VGLNYFQPRLPIKFCSKICSVRLNSSSPESTLYHHLALHKNTGSSSHQIVFKALISVRLESFQTRIHPILSSGSLHNSASFLPSNCPKSLASMHSEYSKHRIDLVPSKPVNLQKPGCSSSSSHQIVLQASYLYAWILSKASSSTLRIITVFFFPHLCPSPWALLTPSFHPNSTRPPNTLPLIDWHTQSCCTSSSSIPPTFLLESKY
jgi:hypothetical protein